MYIMYTGAAKLIRQHIIITKCVLHFFKYLLSKASNIMNIREVKLSHLRRVQSRQITVCYI